MNALPLTIAGERLLLYPERAAYWPARRTLVITDTHWGKAATMRAAAIPIPGGSTRESLNRLTQLIERTTARRARDELLIELGDASLMETYLWAIHRYHREHSPPGAH